MNGLINQQGFAGSTFTTCWESSVFIQSKCRILGDSAIPAKAFKKVKSKSAGSFSRHLWGHLGAILNIKPYLNQEARRSGHSLNINQDELRNPPAPKKKVVWLNLQELGELEKVENTLQH
jgi:hypothetical protein